MPNYDGLSPEEKKRHQAAHEKVAGDFKQATRGEARAPNARPPNTPSTGKALQVQLTINGTVRLVDSPAERLRLEQARRYSERIAAKQSIKVDRAHQRGDLMKEFARAKSHKKPFARGL